MDDDSFEAAMDDVQPLRGKAKAESTTGSGAEEPSLAQQARRDAALGLNDNSVDPNPLTLGEVPQLEPHAVLEWKKDGVQNEVFARLRSGGYAIEAEVDLHGLTVREARERVWQFLVKAMQRNWRCVLIAHGRGEKSQTPARIKSFVFAWLVDYDDVNALVSAERHRGGTGAVYVLLRKSRVQGELTREQHERGV